MNHAGRYINLNLREDELIKDGRHVLCAYIIKPVNGSGFMETAAHFAAESSTGTNVEVSTTDGFTKSVDAIVYHADEQSGLLKIAYPVELFDRNITDGRAMIVSFLTLTIGNNQGIKEIESARMYDFYIPPSFLVLFDGPSMNLMDLRRILRRNIVNGGPIIGTIIKPKLGLRPGPFAEACYSYWLGGDLVHNDDPQGNQTFAPLKETMRLVSQAMRRAQDATGEAKLFTANITADDPSEIIARGEFILETFAENASHVGFLIDGYAAGATAVTTVRRNFPGQFLHYHRAGHGAVTSSFSTRGYSAFVLSKMSRMLGASGIHTGAMGFGKMEGTPEDKIQALMIENDVACGPYFKQDWQGMKPTAPIISGGLNALRIPGFFKTLGHANVIMTAGGGSFGHIDSPASGAKSMRQAYESWKEGVSLVDYARSHYELKRAFESFPLDADSLYPGWREELNIGK